MSLTDQFLNHGQQHKLLSRHKRTLLAVSGGVDSVVLCNLFHEAGLPFAVAHCNFSLRGAESDADERFVRDLAEHYQVKFYYKKFDTISFAETNRLSVQQAARALRYGWFDEIRRQAAENPAEKLHQLATAHHLDDNIETIIYNFIKGTGLRGLRGIPMKNGHVVRPLLFAEKSELIRYAHDKGLTFREDSSNLEEKYARNKIRLQLLPLMRSINPSLTHTLADRIEIAREMEIDYEAKIRKARKQLWQKRNGAVYISISGLKKQKGAPTVLYELLREFDFTSRQVGDIMASLHGESGKVFLTAKARIIKDRTHLILTGAKSGQPTVHYIEEGQASCALGDSVIRIFHKSDKAMRESSAEITGIFNKKKISFPLVVRKWREGDYFYPSGMNGKKKKLKKFFSDNKFSLADKESTWIVESGNRIIWVAGHRIDERFKAGPTDDDILLLKIKKDG